MVWTDTFQTFVVMAGLIAVTVQGSLDVGGIDKVWNIAHNGGRIFFLEYETYNNLNGLMSCVDNLEKGVQNLCFFFLQNRGPMRNLILLTRFPSH